MGRKSKLSPEQWAEVESRLLQGESRRAVGRDFKVSEAAIRAKFAGPVKQIQEVAEQVVAAEVALQELPPLARIYAQNLAAKLRNTAMNLATGADHGSATYAHLQKIAHDHVKDLTAADTLKPENAEKLRTAAGLIKIGNEAAAGANALAGGVHKDSIARLTVGDGPEDQDDDDALAEAAARRLEGK